MSAEAERVIAVEGVTKCFRVWSSPAARLWSAVFRRLASLPILPMGWRKWLRCKAVSGCREFYALQDVSFHVTRGQSVGIIGRNGAGKSTLLQIIAGILQPTTGHAEVRGRVAALLELGSGFNPEFTGRENVRLNAALHGLTPQEIDARMSDILAFADIGDFVDQPVKTYSSGMTLRLAFAVIAHLDADVLIIDEALAVGDVFFVQKCMAFLRQFQERGVLLFVSHSAAAVTALCQQALWLDGGRVRRSGTPKEVTEAYLETFYGEDAGRPRESVVDNPEMDQHDFLTPPDGDSPGFDPEAASFGLRGGRVVDVRMENDTGRALSWVAGGEVVDLRVRFQTLGNLAHPIVGFYVKNGLGQQLFGDNTFAASRQRDFQAAAGERFEARFRFQMPFLPPGDYVVTVALADGTQLEHQMHHWIHDALAFKSVSSPLRPGGILGLPMLSVGIERVTAPAPAPDLALAGV